MAADGRFTTCVSQRASCLTRAVYHRQAKTVLRGNGGVSPLAYATWTSCAPELFKAVCNALKVGVSACVRKSQRINREEKQRESVK